VDLRELKALEIAARSKIGFDGTSWLVPSQTGMRKYRVVLDPKPSCECDDFALRNQNCKHIIACGVVRERDYAGTNPTAIVADKPPKKPTYKQSSWPLYDLAQQTEKNRVQELLADLCRGIKEPERAKNLCGRKPTPLADQVFASVFKVYCGMSARRFGCDLADAHGKGHLVKSIKNPRSVSLFLEDKELTPILKALIVRSSLPLKSIETVFAPDSTGFSSSRFDKWFDEKYGQERSGHAWVKAHAVCGVKTNIVTALEVLEQHSADCPQFKGLIETTVQNFKLDYVTADKGYLSRENLEYADEL